MGTTETHGGRPLLGPTGPRRVLVVDDSKFARGQTAKIVAALGGEVVAEAASGAEGVERYAALRPELVLMDITMPDMDGIGAVQAIREQDPAARIVMISSVTQQEMVRRALAVGAAHFLPKPVTVDLVADVLADVFRDR
jgi:two-component system chemotaxis response regulator CheY